MYGKSNMETYTAICKIDSQKEFAVWLRKLKQGLCINLEGQDGEGDGREVQMGGDMCIPMADSCWGLTENNQNFVKQLSINKNNLIKKIESNRIVKWRLEIASDIRFGRKREMTPKGRFHWECRTWDSKIQKSEESKKRD